MLDWDKSFYSEEVNLFLSFPFLVSYNQPWGLMQLKNECYICITTWKQTPTHSLCLLTHSCCPACDSHVSASCAGRSGARQCQRQRCRPRPRPRHHTLWCSHVRRPPPEVTGSRASDGATTMTGHSPLQRGGSGNTGYWGIGEKLEKEWWTRGKGAEVTGEIKGWRKRREGARDKIWGRQRGETHKDKTNTEEALG